MKTILVYGYGNESAYTDKSGVFTTKFESDDLRFIVSNDLTSDVDAIIVYVDTSSSQNIFPGLEYLLKNIKSSGLNVPYVICLKDTFGKSHYY